MTELDRISDLPSDIIEKILSCLPIKDATRTSLLSSNWRYKSNTLRSLVFDDDCVSTRSDATFTFANIVDQVLLLHSGPIYKFKISCDDEPPEKDMDRWIFHLSRNPVLIELVLELRYENDYYYDRLPSCFFSFKDIVRLKLHDCSLEPPCTFKGFRSLKSLNLDLVSLAQDVLDNLIGGSPLLEKLKLRDFDGSDNLIIDAPNLRFILIVGEFDKFDLKNASNLVDASFDLEVDTDEAGDSRKKLVKMFDHQHPHLQRLTMKGKFLKYLSIGAFHSCRCLKFLSVHICFDYPDQISTVLCLVRSSPVLQELEIMVDTKENVDALVRKVDSCLYDNYNCPNLQLRLVTITKISGVKSQLDFIRYLLLSSPALERMTVQPDSSDDDFPKLVKELLRFKRDSKHAEIVLLDAWCADDDDSKTS